MASAAAAQTPRLSNGRIETRTVSAGVAKDLPALAATLSEPTWVGYTQPLVDGNHEMCDDWNDGVRYSSSTEAIRLEPADFFFVMFRVEDQVITRIRTYSASCPLDAGGKPVYWFNNVTVDASISYLKTFIGQNATRRLNDSAVTALALTDGQRALDELMAMARDGATLSVKGNGLFWLAQRAGQKAVGTIAAAIENDPDTEPPVIDILRETAWARRIARLSVTLPSARC